MRSIDKKKSIQRANLMVEQRYLQSKGLIGEAILPFIQLSIFGTTSFRILFSREYYEVEAETSHDKP